MTRNLKEMWMWKMWNLVEKGFFFFWVGKDCAKGIVLIRFL